MRKLFDITNGQVVMNPSSLWIPQFKKIWDRDKSKDKAIAHKEISYIVFKHAYNSPYLAYNEKDRVKFILNDFFKDDKKWKPDADVKNAEKKFNELQDSISLKLLRSSRSALELIEEFFKTADPSQVDKVIKNAKELGKLIGSLYDLEERVQKEQHERNSARGEAEIGLFEL